MPYTVLIVAPYYYTGAALRDLLVHHGPAEARIRVASHESDALKTVETEPPAAVIVIDDPHEIGIDLLAKRLLAASAHPPRVMALLASDRQAAMEFSETGLFTHVVTQPLNPSEILGMLPTSCQGHSIGAALQKTRTTPIASHGHPASRSQQEVPHARGGIDPSAHEGMARDRSFFGGDAGA